MKDITEIIGVRYPIIQGALGVISNPELVAAVSNAGGYGILATGTVKDPEFLKIQIDTVKKNTKKPFGVNLLAMHPNLQDFMEIIVESGIKAVTTSAGSPKNLIHFLKQQGVKVLHVIANVELVIKAEEAGVDAVIAEGSESGGLQGFNSVSTMVLVPTVVDAVRIPVVAAGGIGDSRGYRAAFNLGAKGVQLGTRFIASQECIAHANCKKILCDANETDTLLIDKGRVRVRVIRTPLAEKLSKEQSDQSLISKLGSIEAAWIEGDIEANILPSGQVAGMIRKVQNVREIIEEMVGDSLPNN